MKPTNNQQANQVAMPPFEQKKGNAKKVLAIVIPIVTLLIIGIVALVLVLAGNKTSSKALSDFNRATSGLNSSLLGVRSGVTSASLSGDTDRLEDSISEANSSLDKFDSVTDGLKSDRQEMKDAALAYSAAVRSYLGKEVVVVTDVARINGFTNDNEPVFDSSTSSNQAAYLAEVGRISEQYALNSQKVKSLEVKSDEGKELRSLYADLYIKLKDLMDRTGAAVQAGNSSEITAIQSELETLTKNGAAAQKTKELEDLLGTSGEGAKNLEAAKDRLNETIGRFNSGR